jgi:hypothetical protein
MDLRLSAVGIWQEEGQSSNFLPGAALEGWEIVLGMALKWTVNRWTQE